jgi:hypothetical protein
MIGTALQRSLCLAALLPFMTGLQCLHKLPNFPLTDGPSASSRQTLRGAWPLRGPASTRVRPLDTSAD